MCLIHADFGALLTLLLYSREKLSPFGDEQARLCVRWSGVTRNPVIVIGIFLLENFQETLACEHVDSASARVVEQIVRRAGNFAGRDFLASCRIKDEQPRRHPASHEQPVMSFVERHREIVLEANRPTGQDSALDGINDFDLILVWNVYEKTSSRFLKLKRLGMGIDDDVTGFLPIGVQKPKPSGALLPFPQLAASAAYHVIKPVVVLKGVGANDVVVVRIS